MDWKDYTYLRTWEPNLGVMIKGAFVEVSLHKNGKKISQIAMIDSGAYITMINAEVSDLLGVDKTKCEKFIVGGITKDRVEGWLCKIELKLDKFNDSIEIPVVFVPDLQTNMLLGQIGFFEKFKIKFECSQNIFSLSSVDETNQYMEGLGEDSGSGFGTILKIN